MPDDPREFPLPDLRPPAGEDPEGVTFWIDPAVIAAPDPGRSEPLLDAGPMTVGFGGAQADPAATERSPPAASPRRRTSGLGVAGSLGVHLLPLLFLLYWNAPAAKIAQPIPVTLVLQTPPAPPPPPPPKLKAEAKPPPGHLASIDMGDPTAKPAKPVEAAEPPAEQPKETHAKATAAPKEELRPPKLVSALPKPAPAPEPDLKPAEPEPAAIALVEPPVKHAMAARPAPQHQERPWGRVPGPSATEDEYLAYANALIRRYQEMLPPTLLKGRNGQTVINILVLTDGTIASIAITESSDYPEIDQRAELMIAAVKRFPPLPRWVKGPSMMLSYHMLFGDRVVLP